MWFVLWKVRVEYSNRIFYRHLEFSNEYKNPVPHDQSYLMLKRTTTRKKNMRIDVIVFNTFYSDHYSWCSGLNKHEIQMNKKNRQVFLGCFVSSVVVVVFFAKSVNFFLLMVLKVPSRFSSIILYLLCLWWLWFACLRSVFFPNLVVVNIQIKMFGSHYNVEVFDLMTIDRESCKKMLRSQNSERNTNMMKWRYTQKHVR